MGAKVANSYETIIGLEVHAQLSTESKMYCACPAVNTQELADANSYVCPVCLGHPGTLPRPNRQSLVKALTLALKAESRLSGKNVFARKNYFYPDLPKGYQISQYELPLAEGGVIPYWHMGQPREARLVRIHLEEDTAKLFHQPDGTAILDYNRGGIPLVEIVTEPDFRSADECISYLEELRSLLPRLGVSAAAMEEGNFRCEPNVSVRPKGDSELRTKTELKNLNSFTTLRRAVEAEAQRQIECYAKGEPVQQATLRYDEARGITVPMRIKETADDYRYFDDPDLLPVVVSKKELEEARDNLRASSFELRRMMTEEDGISHEMAATIASDAVVHRFYRLCCKDGHQPQQAANWVCGELVRLMREAPLKVEPGTLSRVMKMLRDGEVTRPQAKEVFQEAYLTGQAPEAIVQEKGFSGTGSDADLVIACKAAISENIKIVADIKGGKLAAVQALVGQVMRKTKGAADPNKAKEILLELLGIA
jgi:aspartyl-tRNA(Asn)/glutamyl-tRNA(Gln) amidotransferase subunit B